MPKRAELLRLYHEAVKDEARKKNKFVLDHHEGMVALGLLMNNKNRTPESEWILLCIAAVAGPGHKVFAKGYSPPVQEESNRPLHSQAVVWNADGFYDNQKQVSSISRLRWFPLRD